MHKYSGFGDERWIRRLVGAVFVGTLLLGTALAEIRHPEAIELYYCDFDRVRPSGGGELTAADANYDGWPDHWDRIRNLGHPPYVPIAIVEDNEAASGKALEIQLNGGRGTLLSPPISVGAYYSYMLQATVRTIGGDGADQPLRHDRGRIRLKFYDDQDKLVETHETPPLRHVPAWQKVVLGPLSLRHQRIRTARIELTCGPEGEAEDLRGAFLVGELWLARTPRLSIDLADPRRIYHGAEEIEVVCRVDGIATTDAVMTFDLWELTPCEDREPRVVAQRIAPAEGFLKQQRDQRGNLAYSGECRWNPPIPDVGFYRLDVGMQSGQGILYQRSLTLAVAPPMKRAPHGEFGWTLPEGDAHLSLDHLERLVSDAGLHYVKFPIWYSGEQADAKQRGEDLAQFIEHLEVHGVELVGLLDQPPPDLRSRFSQGEERLPAAQIFAEPELWHPALEPVMTRLSLKVRAWQLGRDDDFSFVGLPDVQQRLQTTKDYLQRFGQQVNLGISWLWSHQLPSDEPASWDFTCLSARPALTPAEIRRTFPSIAEHSSRRWLSLRPLAQGHYDEQTRVRDLALRMVAAKVVGADGIFIPDVFDPDHGLLLPDGSPQLLYSPWRTVATQLAGAQFVGSIRMPQGSENYIFRRGRDAVMVVWSAHPTTERLFLGADVQQIDLWGRTRKPETVDGEQVVEVSPMPTILTGVSLPVAQWRMNFHFDKDQLESAFGRPQYLNYTCRNTFGQGVRAKMKVHPPPVWEAHPREHFISAAAGELAEGEIEVQLRHDATSGASPVKIEFEVPAEVAYRFSVYREVSIGLTDLTMTIRSRLETDDALVVELALTNSSTEQVSFNCYLFAPERRRMRKQIFYLSEGRAIREFRLRDGESLLGRSLWIRAEEMQGDRVLNYRLTAEP